jgi:hypothetical protein
MQADGNLVLYKDNHAAWQAPGAWPRGDHADVQEDGNFVLSSKAGQPVWATGTNGNNGAYLSIQEDGNMVVYNSDDQPLWATNTGD